LGSLGRRQDSSPPVAGQSPRAGFKRDGRALISPLQRVIPTMTLCHSPNHFTPAGPPDRNAPRVLNQLAPTAGRGRPGIAPPVVPGATTAESGDFADPAGAPPSHLRGRGRSPGICPSGGKGEPGDCNRLARTGCYAVRPQWDSSARESPPTSIYCAAALGGISSPSEFNVAPFVPSTKILCCSRFDPIQKPSGLSVIPR